MRNRASQQGWASYLGPRDRASLRHRQYLVRELAIVRTEVERVVRGTNGGDVVGNTIRRIELMSLGVRLQAVFDGLPDPLDCDDLVAPEAPHPRDCVISLDAHREQRRLEGEQA